MSQPRYRLQPREAGINKDSRIRELEDRLWAANKEKQELAEKFAEYRAELVRANHSLMADLRAVCRERDLLRRYAAGWLRRVLFAPPEFGSIRTSEIEEIYSGSDRTIALAHAESGEQETE